MISYATAIAPAKTESAKIFQLVFLLLALSAAALAGLAPVGFSIATVFLFAGPHNLFELRYFLSRMPARWGSARKFFLFSFIGIFTLTTSFALLTWFGYIGLWREVHLAAVSKSIFACWDSLLVLWVVGLIWLRSRQLSMPGAIWCVPIALALIVLSWFSPSSFALAVVYMHPCLGFWILDREMMRCRSQWRPAYHRCLLLGPALLALLYLWLSKSQNLIATDELSWRIARHAGSSVLPAVSSHLLVSLHTFLEMLHYGVWLIAIPLVALGVDTARAGGNRSSWLSLNNIPLVWRSPNWRPVIQLVLVTSVMVVIVLWVSFAANYTLTRDIYFTFAIVHVLAEIPFLLRAL